MNFLSISFHAAISSFYNDKDQLREPPNMGFTGVINRFLYPLEDTETYKDKRGSVSRPQTSESEATSLFRPRGYRNALLGGFLRSFRRRRDGGFLVVCAILAIVTFWWKVQHDSTKHCASCECTFPPDVGAEPRGRDSMDTFANFSHRGASCDVSSLDLHRSFGPVCPDRDSVLKAMSDGGRVGRDAPYVPRGCDMRWYNTQEVCEILDRFSQVILVGDSMLRHIIGAMNVLIREDLGYGGVTD